jgi:hypothetical protein
MDPERPLEAVAPDVRQALLRELDERRAEIRARMFARIESATGARPQRLDREAIKQQGMTFGAGLFGWILIQMLPSGLKGLVFTAVIAGLVFYCFRRFERYRVVAKQHSDAKQIVMKELRHLEDLNAARAALRPEEQEWTPVVIAPSAAQSSQGHFQGHIQRPGRGASRGQSGFIVAPCPRCGTGFRLIGKGKTVLECGACIAAPRSPNGGTAE